MISDKTGMTAAEASKILAAILDSVEDALAIDGKITLRDLGTFRVYTRAPRRGRNLATGEEMTLEEAPALKFIPAAHLKELVNGGQKKPDPTYFKIF